ncbi:glycosyltransferase [Fluviicola chungangensis]|uniref:Glycosyltransferase family 4 protein n=1 Tax=Fluviicola chungangensis TaxID=2597671 RepID=A0A556N199_9FLAO|nr:glycosyltransferase [Fluviicola chungangensis]TSJ45799.1 glycosyltransferase family 4 protein [Fluviicola chungangensis]
MKPKILFIEICNYKDYPIGGYLAFAKQMVTAFGNELALVGMSDDTPVGMWTKKEIDGTTFDFFSVRQITFNHKKSWIPGRLKAYLAVRKYRRKIFDRNFHNVFIQTPEVLFALSKIQITNLCTRIPGVENPMAISRYWYGKYFARIFDLFFFNALMRSDVIFASADTKAIKAFLARGHGKLTTERVIQFPTRVNTEIFQPREKLSVRKQLGFSTETKIIVTSGRLSKLKGWELLLESFTLFLEKFPDSKFIFAGDGEDRNRIEEYVSSNALTEKVIFTGRIDHPTLSHYLNAADIFVMGSFVEGWSTSLVEAISSGKPIVCTDFSSADELIIENKNGFIINDRNPKSFSEAMIAALSLPEQNLTERSSEMEKYAVVNLKQDILSHWKLK